MHAHNAVTAALAVLIALFGQGIVGHETSCPGTNYNGICCIGSLDGPVISSLMAISASVISSVDTLLCIVTGCTDTATDTQSAAASTTESSSMSGPETVIESGVTCHGVAVVGTASNYDAIISSAASASVRSEGR